MAIFGADRNISKKQVAAYVLLPQVLPRINALYRTGFANLAYMIALVYRAVNLLPANHPVFKSANRSELGLGYVLGAAAAELKFTKEHIDQVIIYFAILVGIVILGLQFFLTAGYLLVNPALASAGMPQNYGDFFVDPQANDIAYKMLFAVFGVPELFKAGGSPSQFHKALHSLFQLYSTGLLVIAAITICYFIFAIVVETAQTGVPFGKRYNHVWAPIRLVFALGLLIPIGYGLNAAQWITLYSAKFGSDFATKGWTIFSDTLSGKYINPNERNVGTPQAPELVNLAAFMMVVQACDYAYEKFYTTPGSQKIITGYLIKPGEEGSAPVTLDTKGFADAQKYFNNGDILIRFGEHNDKIHGKQLGNVAPYCGDIIIPASDAREDGSLHIQEYYYGRIRQMFRGGYELKIYGENYIKKYAADFNVRENAVFPPPADFKSKVKTLLANNVETEIKVAVEKQGKSKTWDEDLTKLKEYGWGGAGMWYNKIAQVNGSLVTAVGNIPQIRSMPMVMEYMKAKQLQQNYSLPDAFTSIYLADGREMSFDSETEKEIGILLGGVYKYWEGDLDQSATGNQANPTGNFMIDAINLVFGTKGLFNMCANADTHPLAQLSLLGKGLMEASIRNLGIGYGLKLGTLMGDAIGAAAGAASSIMLSIATLTITMGFILFYVLPFMPFLYFFFAVTGWIKGLFEAMVGVPLWALAHLRIDGEGLQGDAAKDGLYLIFEIFIRPILIVFGLLAAVIIFAAMVKVLNEIFYLVVTNLSGHDGTFKQLCGKSLSGGTTPGAAGAAGSEDFSSVQFYRGPIDEFFFTVIYAIIVYMIGLSCFKLIDLVPNNILRYMGVNARTFNDAAEDITGGMLGKLTYATNVASEQVLGEGGVASGAIKSLGQGISGGGKDIAKMGGGGKT